MVLTFADDISTWDDRIVLVADDEDFAEMQQEWLAKKTADAQAKTGLRGTNQGVVRRTAE